MFASLRHSQFRSVPVEQTKSLSQDMPGHINLFIFHCLFVPFLFQEFSVKFVKNHIRQICGQMLQMYGPSWRRSKALDCQQKEDVERGIALFFSLKLRFNFEWK